MSRTRRSCLSSLVPILMFSLVFCGCGKIECFWMCNLYCALGVCNDCIEYCGPCPDNDGDGYGDTSSSYFCLGWDCDDSNPDVNPEGIEGPYGDPSCGDGLDNDCDGHVDLDDIYCIECIDNDNDGFGILASANCTDWFEDCDDSNPDINPGATEGPYGDPTCSDMVDNDCDDGSDLDDLCCGSTCVDNDNDGWLNGDPYSCYCLLHPDGDCDDEDPDINPGVIEGPYGDPTCSDMVDNNCDLRVDLEDWNCCGECTDNDGDFYNACEAFCVDHRDCDDANPDVHPSSGEICDNEIDDNCDELIDSADPYCWYEAKKQETESKDRITTHINHP